MRKINNVTIYLEDLEIVEILTNIPKSEGYQTKNVLRFFQENAKGTDFGTIIPHNDEVYVLYTFDPNQDSQKDAGLFLTVSKNEYMNEQVEVWNSFKDMGMPFTNKIFNSLMDALVAFDVFGIFDSNNK